jgi:hypothetical protein
MLLEGKHTIVVGVCAEQCIQGVYMAVYGDVEHPATPLFPRRRPPLRDTGYAGKVKMVQQLRQPQSINSIRVPPSQTFAGHLYTRR